MAVTRDEKLTKLSALKALAEKVNSQVEDLDQRIAEVEAASGEDNVIEVIKVNGTAVEVKTGKTVELTIPTTVGELTNDEGYQTASDVAAAVAAAEHLQRKIVENVGAINTSASDADKYIYLVPKTDSATNDSYDEYMVISGKLEKVGDWKVDLTGYAKTTDIPTIKKSNDNGKITVGESDIEVYSHPVSTAGAKESGLYKITTDANGHVTGATAVEKDDITSLGIPETNTTYNEASTTVAGLMSAGDKEKLDGIEIASATEVSAMLKEVFDEE